MTRQSVLMIRFLSRQVEGNPPRNNFLKLAFDVVRDALLLLTCTNGIGLFLICRITEGRPESDGTALVSCPRPMSSLPLGTALTPPPPAAALVG